MDDLTNSFNSFVTSDSNNINLASTLHPRLLEYKKKSTTVTINQETRRRQILEEQKKKRQELVEQTRHKNESPQSATKQKKSNYRKAPYNLMFSEWLEEIPHDFETNWIMCLCPVGKRCLVVASEGSTIIYNKAGKILTKHRSKLPGGNNESKIDFTILDCLYNDVTRTYYVLDCLCWKSHPILDTETEFRFYWLKCKLEETPALKNASTENPYKFIDIPRFYECKKEVIEAALAEIYPYEIDGVLFYHKETHYTCDYTPLVGWLRPYMLPEILNVNVPQAVLSKAPSDYNNARNEISSSNIEIDRFKNYLNKRAALAAAATAAADSDDATESLPATMDVDNKLLSISNISSISKTNGEIEQ